VFVTLFAGFIVVLGLAYIILILIYLRNWDALPDTKIPDDFIGKTAITVIIPIRNESDNISQLLKSILANKYPKQLLEIIVVDDHSTDKSAKLVYEFDDNAIKVLSLSEYELPQDFNSFKKFGIEEAVKRAEGELILTTDGDCIVPEIWLNAFAYAYEFEKKQFIAAPVNFNYSPDDLIAFQCLDFMGMMLITGANIHRKKSLMCNGANMGYSKNLFLELGGYKGINKNASGDDVMLLNKVAEQDMDKIGFIKNKDVTVHTQAAMSWSQFRNQRLRWATKNSSSPDIEMKIELGIVYLVCCSILFSFIFLIYNWYYGMFILFFLVNCKLIGDLILLRKAIIFFEKEELFNYFIGSFGRHIFYIAGIGTLSLFSKQYQWKGRKVN